MGLCALAGASGPILFALALAEGVGRGRLGDALPGVPIWPPLHVDADVDAHEWVYDPAWQLPQLAVAGRRPNDRDQDCPFPHARPEGGKLGRERPIGLPEYLDVCVPVPRAAEQHTSDTNPSPPCGKSPHNYLDLVRAYLRREQKDLAAVLRAVHDYVQGAHIRDFLHLGSRARIHPEVEEEVHAGKIPLLWEVAGLDVRPPDRGSCCEQKGLLRPR
jgi:hypothetical protein